jgi:uncharacterized surface protein with fasciclin (FAS1) repeats
MKKLSFLFILFTGLVLISSCKKDDDTTPAEKNIVELAQETPELSLLVEAVIAADLAGTLSGDGPFTVFAPTNAAFEAALAALGVELSDLSQAQIAGLLLYHTLSGKVRSSDLTDTYVSTLSPGGPGLTNTSLQIQVTGGVKFNGNASPVTVDIVASNGIIHIIDAVMLPKNVVELALANDNFTSLVAALTRSDLEDDFVDILSGDGPFTVFAPTNAAFTALLSDLGYATLADVPVDVLTEVLKYHVVAGANVRSNQLSNGQTVTTFQGQDFTINLGSGASITTASSGSANIVLTDVQGTNGVIHVVDAVLVPAL